MTRSIDERNKEAESRFSRGQNLGVAAVIAAISTAAVFGLNAFSKEDFSAFGYLGVVITLYLGATAVATLRSSAIVEE